MTRGFPIAIGTGPHSSSSRPYPQLTDVSEQHAVMTTANNADDSLTAVVFVYYRYIACSKKGSSHSVGSSDGADGREGKSYNVIAELRVQIQPTHSPFTSDSVSRETKCKVPLGTLKRCSNDNDDYCDDDNISLKYQPGPSVIFSSQDRQLVCLIPFPYGFESVSSSTQSSLAAENRAVSIVVIFSTQSQHIRKKQTSNIMPPLPSYIEDTTDPSSSDDSKSDVYYMAHCPRIVRQHTATTLDTTSGMKHTNDRGKMALQSVTAICDIVTDSSHQNGSLLVGTVDGSLLLVDYGGARVCHVFLSGNEASSRDVENGDGSSSSSSSTGGENGDGSSSNCNTDSNPIVHISQCPPSIWKPQNIYGEEQGSISFGRITLIKRNGSAIVYATSFTPSNNSYLRSTSDTDYWRSSSVSSVESNIQMQSPLVIKLERIHFFGLTDKHIEEPEKLRYVRSKWLNPQFLVLLMRTRNLDDTTLLLRGRSGRAHASSEVMLAQVWRIIMDDTQSSGTTSSNSSVMLVSELKQPLGEADLMRERSHGTFSVGQYSSSLDACNNNVDVGLSMKQMTSFVTDCESAMSISYHRDTGCLTLCTLSVASVPSSAQIKVHSCCLIWDWKRNVSGLTLFSSIPFNGQSDEPSFFSRFYICESSASGLSAVHVYKKRTTSGKKVIQRDSFRLGVLSPNCRSTHNEGLGVNDPSALLLSSDSVMYPFLDRSLNSADAVLRWEECRVPPSYLLNNGYCRLAAVTSDGCSIAVAADRGLCILDLHQRSEPPVNGAQWKMFSRVNEEQSFRVLQMVWWNRNENIPERQNNRGDDIIVAIIQYTHSEMLHLVAWSHRRLGFDDQLIIDAPISLNGGSEAINSPSSFPGIQMPWSGLHSMSIIADPSGNDHRALLMITLNVFVPGESSAIKYAVYQLQTRESQQRKSESVLSRLLCSGVTSLDAENTLGLFLAGGSFLYDLNEQEHSEPQLEPPAIVGAITISQGLVAVSLFESKPPTYQHLMVNSSGRLDSSGLIVSYHQADHFSYKEKSVISWNVAKNDGVVCCWVVPCLNVADEEGNGVNVSSHDDLDFKQHHVTGAFCYLGASSLWMNGASTNENEIAIGHCSKSFVCNLFASQRSRIIAGVGQSISSLHVSNCIVGPPPFTSVLYTLLLSNSMSGQNNLTNTNDIVTHYIRSRSSRFQSLSVLSSIRVIVFKIIDMLGAARCKDLSCIRWSIGKRILHEVVDALTNGFDVLAVATFWLSIGRQLEPHQFDLIFPLPSSPGETIDMSTAEDLFATACLHGSLSTALSALPLFSCHMASQRRVVQLIYHCLEVIKESFKSMPTSVSCLPAEEMKFVHQLFWFGVKLEDAIESLDLIEDSESSSDESIMSATSLSSDTESDKSSADSKEVMATPRRAAKIPAKSGIISKVVTKIFSTKDQTNGAVDENAIHEAASNFIISGFGSPIESRLTTPLPVRKVIARSMRTHDQGTTKRRLSFDEANSIQNPLEYSDITVAGAVTTFISSNIGLGKESSSDSTAGWQIVSLVAHLLQGDRETATITAAASANAHNISRVSTINVDSLANDGQDHGDEIILRFFRELISGCALQIRSEAAGAIFNLILLLLLRYDTCEDVHASKTALILVGIVTGHVSGRIDELIYFKASNPIRDVYLSLVRSLEE